VIECAFKFVGMEKKLGSSIISRRNLNELFIWSNLQKEVFFVN